MTPLRAPQAHSNDAISPQGAIFPVSYPLFGPAFWTPLGS